MLWHGAFRLLAEVYLCTMCAYRPALAPLPLPRGGSSLPWLFEATSGALTYAGQPPVSKCCPRVRRQPSTLLVGWRRAVVSLARVDT